MRSERLALYTTWYPGVEPYLPTWLASVDAQTDKDFDVWVGVDSLDPERLIGSVAAPRGANWIAAERDSTPARLRQRAIDRLASEYRAVIFADSDDWLLPDRIESARVALGHHDVTGCALRIVDEKGKDTGLVFGPSGTVDWDEFLPRYNVFGLSNTAFRADALRRLPPAPIDGPAIDWSLATRAWCAGFSFHFDPVPQMAYRQYARNVAKVVPPFSAGDVVCATEVVRAHYRALLDGGVPLPSSFRSRLETARERAEKFRERVIAMPERLERYVVALNELEPLFVWWWCVAHPQLEQHWTN